MKKLAIHLFGHARTYKKTAESFLNNIVEANKDKWDIDIFMHTWDMFEPLAQTSWHKHNETLSGVKLQDNDIKDMQDAYKPKRYIVETLQEENGFKLSHKKVNDMRRNYAIENNIKYDYMLYTRYDILFTTKLDLSFFIDSYYEVMEREHRLPVGGGGEKLCFVGHNIFGRMPFLEYIPEPDLIWFANYDPYDIPACRGGIHEGVRPIDYRLYRDFFIQRVNMRLEVGSRIDALRFNTQSDIAKLSRSYKIGEAILINTKHCFGYLRLPIILYYINKQHRQQETYQLEFYETNNKGIDSISKIGLAYMRASNQGLRSIFNFIYKELPKLKLDIK